MTTFLSVPQFTVPQFTAAHLPLASPSDLQLAPWRGGIVKSRFDYSCCVFPASFSSVLPGSPEESSCRVQSLSPQALDHFRDFGLFLVYHRLPYIRSVFALAFYQTMLARERCSWFSMCSLQGLSDCRMNNLRRCLPCAWRPVSFAGDRTEG